MQDFNEMTSTSPTAGQLHNLCRQGSVAAIREQLQGIGDVSQLEERVGFLGYTPLHEATNQGHVGVVRLLLLYGANPSAKANGSYTPLHMAASMDNVECVVELIKHSADITSRDEFGKTPFETAVINRCKGAARLLKSAEIKKAATENHPNLKEILKSVRDRDVTPQCYQEALLAAIRMGHLEAISVILLVGSKENLRLKDAIREAVKFHFYNAAAVLLVCYAAKHAKEELLKYVMGVELHGNEHEIALSDLPYESVLQMNMEQIKAFLRDRDRFQVAVPIRFACQHKKTASVKILLRCTNCNPDKREVEWRKLALCEIDKTWLEQVKWVEKLYLSSNLLTSVPTDIVDLRRLCKLDLRRNQLKSIPAELLQMPFLKELILSENKISELPKKCSWSPSLSTLNLSDNLLEKLPKSMASAKLVNLYLARNNLYEVPSCVCEMITLASLNLSSNPRLTSLPILMGKLTKLTFLKLDNLEQMTDPPDSIKKSAEKTIMYLRARLRSSRRFYWMKLLLVGKANQGKTTLMHRLMWDYNYNVNSPTNGIFMDEFPLRKSIGHQVYQFKVWDFGGQEDYHATHQLFLSTLGLYVLVWNLVEGLSGVQELEGWLDTISARSPGTSLVIVGTHLDIIRKDHEKFGESYLTDMHERVKQLAMLPKYAQINVVEVKEVSSALDYREGINDLRSAIYDAATHLLKDKRSQIKVMGELIPHSYLMLVDLIQGKKNELRKAGELPIMHRAEYEALVVDTIRNDTEDIEDPDDVREVTRFLHERGFLIHYDDPNQDLQDLYFIDPKWLCELMARVVTLREVNPFIINGILNKKDFAVTFKGEKFADENYPQFIRLLNRFQIACSLDDERVLVPSKLPAAKPEQATADQLPFITIKRVHSLPYMPYGLWNRFTARLLSYTKDMLAADAINDEWLQHVQYSSQFQLDPFCCRCPLTVIDADPAPAEPSAQPSEPSEDPDVEVVCEADDDVEDGAVGFSGFGGLWINGKFIRNNLGSGDNSPRSDSGFEFSSEDEADDGRDKITSAGPMDDWNAASPGSDSNMPYGSNPPTTHTKPAASEPDGRSQSSTLNDGSHASFEFKPHNPAGGECFTPVSPPTSARSSSDPSDVRLAQNSDTNSHASAHPLISGASKNASAAVPIPRGSSSFKSHVTAGDKELESSPLQNDPSSSTTSSRTSSQAPEFVDPSVSSGPPDGSTGSSSSFVSADDESSLRHLKDDVFTTDTASSSAQVSEPSPENPLNNASQDPSGEGLSRDSGPDNTSLSECAENGISGLRPKATENVIRSISQEQTHLSDCPCAEGFPMDGLPELPVDLCALVDGGFLHCWLSGVCLHHPRLFFMVTKEPDPSQEGRQCIVTQVSPSPLGRRILSYIVDHVDTLIREWYPNLSQTDGRELIVRQQIPCVVCERLCLEPYRFSFVQCQQRSSVSDRIDCPKHSGLELNLHHVAPDVMLHDVGVDLLLSHDELKYENSETNLLGSGGFGKVVRGECRGQPVAIKFYNSGDETDPLRHYLEVRKELNVLRRVRQHPYLINIIGVSLRPLCLVLELAEKGSLLESLMKPIAIHRIVLFRIAYQVADALAFLHGMGIIYRDLKPENVLVWSLDEKKDLHVKLIDFGTANFATSAGLFSCKGSKGNNAPEMLENKDEYTAQVDVYSYAILLYRLLTRRSPFENFDSEPQVNAAVLRGERPTWKDVCVASYGLPTLTELMLRCWLTKPTLRPTTAQIAEQLRQPAFQALLGKQAVPTHHSVRCSCLMDERHELWLACDNSEGNKVLIFDTLKLEVKDSFSIDSYQDRKCAFQIQCMHAVSEHVLIGLRGDLDLINIYSTTTRYKCIRSIPFNVQITSLASNEEYVFVGLNEGRVHCIWKKDLKKADKRRPARDIPVERHQIQSLVAVKDRLWVAASKYIFSYFTKAGDMEAFDMEALWYGGSEGLDSNPQARVQNLTVSFDQENVWSSCRAVLIKWNATSRHKKFEVDCTPIIKQVGSEVIAGVKSEVSADVRSEVSAGAKSKGDSDVEACITCLMLTFETVWVSTTSGHILIFNADDAQLLTWFHVLQDVRTLDMCIGPGPCETEQCYVISTGKGLLPHGLGTTGGAVVCPLTPERVNELSDEESPRKTSDRSHKRTLSKSSAKLLKVNSESSFESATDGPDVSLARPNCVMLVWEAVSASVFARMEAKSGRRVVVTPRENGTSEGQGSTQGQGSTEDFL